MKKTFVLFFCCFFLFFGCAPLMKYEPPKIEASKKIEPYKLPEDPFSKVDPPKAIFLAKADTINLPGSFWKEVSKEQAELVCYTAREHNKIVLRLQYYKELVPQLENLINIYIQINNVRIELQVDERLAKEVYKQMWIDAVNKGIIDKRWANFEKAGHWALILGLLVEVGILAL